VETIGHAFTRSLSSESASGDESSTLIGSMREAPRYTVGF
jgi:hypothetical protein